jgi:hypothetical protein
MALFSGQEPQSFVVAGFELRCEICKHTKFLHRRAQMHSAVATFFDVEWATPSADCYVCANCGYVHWFLPTR